LLPPKHRLRGRPRAKPMGAIPKKKWLIAVKQDAARLWVCLF
jgi:hypothetical protein